MYFCLNQNYFTATWLFYKPIFTYLRYGFFISGDELFVCLTLGHPVYLHPIHLRSRAHLSRSPVRVHLWVQVVKTGHVGLVRELLLAGANPNVADPACGLTVLHDTSRDGFKDTVETLLEHGADANMVANDGNLPLHLAAAEGHLEVVQMLLGKTENPQLSNNQGATAFQLAAQRGKVDTVQYLLEHFSPRESSASSARAFLAFFSRPKRLAQ